MREIRQMRAPLGRSDKQHSMQHDHCHMRGYSHALVLRYDQVHWTDNLTISVDVVLE
jgi:hypothetical protein